MTQLGQAIRAARLSYWDRMVRKLEAIAAALPDDPEVFEYQGWLYWIASDYPAETHQHLRELGCEPTPEGYKVRTGAFLSLTS